MNLIFSFQRLSRRLDIEIEARRSSALSISSGCGVTRVFVERYVKLPRVEKKKEDFL
jgi:hypothetical protein